jgi:hypothetical protein
MIASFAMPTGAFDTIMCWLIFSAAESQESHKLRPTPLRPAGLLAAKSLNFH